MIIALLVLIGVDLALLLLLVTAVILRGALVTARLSHRAGLDD